ncbi:histidine kinase [candidate division KSB1 bacterium]|nr:histidine kinase [candidate division KSB1 bacterium]
MMHEKSAKISPRLRAWLAAHRRAVKWLVIFLFITLIGVVNFNRFYTNELAEGKTPSFHQYFINEMTGAYAVFVLLPILFYFFKKAPLKRDNLLARLPAHLLASMLYGFCHTMLMFFSRKLLYWLVLQKDYDYGHLGYRLLMEYNHQFFEYWLIYGIVFFVNMVREHQRQRLKAAELERQLTAARLQALQMQLNPHFLFNTLNVISSTMYDDVKAADKMMADLSDLLRKTLNGANWQEHALKNELELVELYVKIMKARFHDKLLVKMDIDDETLEALVPGFVLQPLVENSIRYGMESLQSTEIAISSRKENGRMKLIVRDNGPGIADAPGEIRNNGVGLSNTAERLERLYGRNHRFHFRNMREGGLEVEMEIPFRCS